MAHTLSKAALVLLALIPVPVAAQQTGAGASGRMTLQLRRPAWFGFALDCQDCGSARAASSTARRAPVIARIWPDGPAARAALQVGDTIITADGKALTAPELRDKLGALRAGATLRLTVGGRRGRSTVSLVAENGQIEVVGGDSLPVRYRGEIAEMTIDVLSMTAPVVTRDSTGATFIRVGEHVIRLYRAP